MFEVKNLLVCGTLCICAGFAPFSVKVEIYFRSPIFLAETQCVSAIHRSKNVGVGKSVVFQNTRLESPEGARFPRT